MTEKIVNFLLLIIFMQAFTCRLELRANEIVEKKAIEDVIDQYFISWSSADMNGYESCFHPKAIIHFEYNGNIKEQMLPLFIQSQKKAHENASNKMKEIPIFKKIQFDRNIAHVEVRWKLTANNREQFGYDFFTLIKYKQKWRITYLIFTND